MCFVERRFVPLSSGAEANGLLLLLCLASRLAAAWWFYCLVACICASHFFSSFSSRSVAELEPWLILAFAYWPEVVLTSVNVCPAVGIPAGRHVDIPANG
ncbi:hypothetical protein CORC01_13608 [Colletotrichum orchidophilum]|uniref:Uncharacterized protein n=1 Tax=Colletotrichum orchidophilum TaxID=1209926 RepID=A0A1G4APK0_9PEZI|nr:uncharacterized protein CORC01_13608 [Colletotrichum orchidophilum]OHE91089.1 hypothetical protein CORC01_13608 [Colletotrichum orchidophilum]